MKISISRPLRGLLAILAGILWVMSPLEGCASGPQRADVSPKPMPPGESFNGVWFSPQYGEMRLTQTGTAVVGEYEKNQRSGRIQGRVSGHILRFTWTERRELVSGLPRTIEGRGYFELIMGEDGRTNAIGEWGMGLDEVGGGIWRAYRLRQRSTGVSVTAPGGAAGAADNSTR